MSGTLQKENLSNSEDTDFLRGKEELVNNHTITQGVTPDETPTTAPDETPTTTEPSTASKKSQAPA